MGALARLRPLHGWQTSLQAIWCLVLLTSGCLPAALSCGLHDGSVHHGQAYDHALRALSQRPQHAAAPSSRGGTPRRQLLSLEAMDSLDMLDTAEAVDLADQMDMYPRDSSSVQRYLQEGLKKGAHEIPVWFVVVTDPREPRSIISQPQAEQQVQLLNDAYSAGLPDRPAGVVSEDAASTAGSQQQQHLWRFKLMGVRYTSSKTPMCIGSKLEQQLKSLWHPQLVEATRKAGGQAGTAAADRTLIIYTTDLTSPACKGMVPGYKALFGWSNTPMELQYWKQRGQGFRDGVVLDFRYLYHADQASLEAGPKSLHGASTGAQLVHECGHWLGLLHTFVGGCSSDASLTDGVDDTPAEAHPRSWGVDLGDASGGCRERDTCPDAAGADSRDNYMSYNNLSCAVKFTPGQQARMLYLFNSMRAASTQ